jgi:hypothetical protein
VLTEEMPGPPEWVQEWYCPPPPDHAWFRVTRDDWVQTGDKYTRRVFAWTTAITVLTVRGEFTLEVVPSWS